MTPHGPSFSLEDKDKALIRRSKNRLNWCWIRSLGNSRVVRTSPVWLILVPMLARALTPIAGHRELQIPWLATPIATNIGLPFSWELLYASAFAFFIGQVTYSLACPGLVKNYRSFGEFHVAHPGTATLNSWLTWLIMHVAPKDLILMQEDLFVALRVTSTEHKRLRGMASYLEKPDASYEYPSEAGYHKRDMRLSLCSFWTPLVEAAEHRGVADTFDVISRAASYIRPVLILLSSAFFAVGLLLFLTVVVQNGLSVLRVVRAG
jgi:hypothetical protein